MKLTASICILFAALLVPPVKAGEPVWFQIALATVLGVSLPPQDSTQGYLQHLIGQRLILRHYARSSNPEAKERDLSNRKGGCDEAVEVTTVASDNSSIRLQLRNIGMPSIRKKSGGCETTPDLYSFRITDFDLDQPRDQAERAIGYVLQTPEAYLAASGVTWNRPPSSENDSPVDFPHPGLTAPEVVLSVIPYYSEANRKAHIQGTVTVRCVIGTDGLIHAPVIAKGLTEATNKLALDALTFWRLEPVREGAHPVAARVPVDISFRPL